MKAFVPLLILIILFLMFAVATSQTEQSEIQAGVIINSAFSVTPTNISATVLPFSFLEKNLTFRQNTAFDFNIYLQSTGNIANWLSFSDNNLTIAPSQERIITVFFEIPDTSARTYTGNIMANDFPIPVTITVFDNYKLNSSLTVTPSAIQVGDNITIFATIGIKVEGEEAAEEEILGRATGVEGRIPIIATYDVQKSKRVIVSFTTTNEVTDVIEESFTIQIPENASMGRYKATLTAMHLDKKTTSRDRFFVSKRNGIGRFLVLIFSFLGKFT